MAGDAGGGDAYAAGSARFERAQTAHHRATQEVIYHVRELRAALVNLLQASEVLRHTLQEEADVNGTEDLARERGWLRVVAASVTASFARVHAALPIPGDPAPDGERN